MKICPNNRPATTNKILFGRFLCFLASVSDLHACGQQQSITDLIAVTILGSDDTVFFRFNFNCVDCFVHLRIEWSTNRFNWLHSGASQGGFKTVRGTAHTFQYRLKRAALLASLDCPIKIIQDWKEGAYEADFLALAPFVGRTIQTLPRLICFSLQLRPNLIEARLDLSNLLFRGFRAALKFFNVSRFEVGNIPNLTRFSVAI